ncbi:GH92 family glycosyl hydrolase [Flavobacterium reichenbachii]|uniref:Alpha-mannosidase n=1 Tax=Flavobacterium reichenbachii TaxID=362418 RepID=A0A085ZDX1_9FLAO|nr:GH92 family glycosyl hydrolase [Flavobacterium reichenbachii]KFF02635.1 alpha-mannosidase [Flavobacterium reichenbachii]OXB11130.1 alpha-mannosidase [Flavobacterium reichenbachii]
MKLNKIYNIGCIGISLVLVFLASCKAEKNIPQKEKQLSDMVYPLLDTENSRWFFFSSASRPFGMVNLNPDTEIKGDWGGGYKYTSDTVKGFSHIHEWQLSGVSVMPVTISEQNKQTIFKDFYSKFSHKTEKITPGYHSLLLDRYQITAELTSTQRVGFHRYTFPETAQKAVLFNLNTILGPCENTNGKLEKNNDYELSGSLVLSTNFRRPKPLTVFFKIKTNEPITSVERDNLTGNYLINFNKTTEKIVMKVGISYTSIENANNNIETELPHWDFDKTISDSKKEWSNLLGRIKVEGGTETDQRRFYTDLWHALQGRKMISDANGSYPDNTGEKFRVGQLPLNADGKPKFNHYNSDAFWGAQWTINNLWGLVYPEIMEEFVYSLMQYYKDGGMIPRGPSGGNDTYVMTGASATPFIVSAIQKEIVKEDLEAIYTALKKNHMPGGIMAKAGYEHKTDIGGGLKYYIEKGFVPYPLPEGNFGSHEDGASQTLEYAYQDWTLAQLAKKLNHQEDYNYFITRSKNYQNVFDQNTGWMRPKNVEGKWRENYDPYQYENGFIEANGAQSTWFVPHDIEGLADLMGGKEKAAAKLNAQFETAKKQKYTSGTSHDAELHPEFSRIPVNFGNQPSMQTSNIFTLLKRPDLTQYWTRNVVKETFSGLAPNTGYNGDEDQGLMGSLNVLLKIGLFQMNGGTDHDAVYQIGSPIFNKISIQLNPKYYSGKSFVINASNNSAENVYIKDIKYNNKAVKDFTISHKEITNGGELSLEMSSKAER